MGAPASQPEVPRDNLKEEQKQEDRERELGDTQGEPFAIEDQLSLHELLDDLISVNEVIDVRVKTILHKMGCLHDEQKVTN
jgi:hypothetical protein